MLSTVTTARAANALNPCLFRHCHEPREGLSHWCRPHTRTARRYGHPAAGPVKRREWAPHRQEVEQLLAANEGHSGLHQVVQFIDRWMQEAALDPQRFKGAREVTRLHAHGITARALLVEFLAASLWLHDRGHALPCDRSRDFFLSRAVYGLAPRPRRACGGRAPYGNTWGMKSNTPKSYAPKALTSGLAFIGQHLRVTLAVFTANVVHGIESERQAKVDPMADQRAPLQAPSRQPHRPAPGALPFPLPQRSPVAG